MEQNNHEKNPFLEEEESSFDIMEWLSYFLHHWYLFVIGVILSLGLAYLENRTWLPSFQTAGTVMIEENRVIPNGSQALMQGFGVDAGFRNVNNQVIMFGSYDLVCKVVDSIPFLKVDYITKGNFKSHGRYNQPIQHNLFFITVKNANKYMGNMEMFFQFRSRESLVSDFSSRLNLGFVTEGSSVLQISIVSETPDRDIDFINKLC